MSRPPGIEFAGALHHAMACGDRREEIFRDNRDRMRFLGYLAEGAERYRVKMHCYVLMENHFHLVGTTTEATSPDGYISSRPHIRSTLIVGINWLGIYFRADSRARSSRHDFSTGHISSALGFEACQMGSSSAKPSTANFEPERSSPEGFLDHAINSFLLCDELVERQHAFSGT